MSDRRLSSIHHSSFITHHFPVLAEILLVFAVFFIQGAAPVPDVNEPYYLGRAIHLWNQDWAPGDFFLESQDPHQAFYYAFGWLSLWLSPPALAWFGRVLTWGLLAWSWRRLSFALLPRRWYSILTAALLVCLIDRGHMAGEWVVGGVEAKGFAFVLVFLALEALVRGRWNRVWLLLGAASALHVLVGGWSAVAAGLAWLLLGKDRPALRSMGPALLGGFLLSLPGLFPGLTLNWGTDAETVRRANEIYVYERLRHHLDPLQISPHLICRFVLLSALWLVLCHRTAAEEGGRRLRAFVAGAILIALVGTAIATLAYYDRALAAGLLRFYWFRLADVAVPLGVALEATSFTLQTLRSRPAVGKCSLALAVLVAGFHVGSYAMQRPFPALPRAYRMHPKQSANRRCELYLDWRRACEWIARPGNVAADARFLTPMMSQTFKWYAGRAEVANWKEIPQDAREIVDWRQRIEDLYATGSDRSDHRWYPSLAHSGAERLMQLGKQYKANYVITVAVPRLDLDAVYENNSYIVYRLRRPPQHQHH